MFSGFFPQPQKQKMAAAKIAGTKNFFIINNEETK
jgi:hypothetical protein